MNSALLESVQQNLGYPPLQKADPNTQEVPDENKSPKHTLGQAAIPAVLTGLYKYVQSDEGALDVLAGGGSLWTNKIFREHRDDVVKRVADYCHQDPGTVAGEMDKIAEEAVKVAKTSSGDEADVLALKNYFLNQRPGILERLPAVLNMGEWLEDDSIDDRTNKMRGPISNLVKNLGGAFSNAVEGDGSK